MNAVIFCKDQKSVKKVFSPQIIAQIKSAHHLEEKTFSKADMEQAQDLLAQTECIFSTWGMESLSKEEIARYFPKLKYVFYAAGSVQGFAEAFLDSGVRVYSAWQANAVPVAEFTYGQILLAAKGCFTAQKRSRWNYYGAARFSDACGGLYNAKIGIIGVGGIGSMVAEKLTANDVQVLYYDPFLSVEKASALGIQKATLEQLFSECDVITNHLANKEELIGVLNYGLFCKMKPYAVFINTGRGRQVNEKDLAKALGQVKTRTALLDVTAPEPKFPFHRLVRRKNILITPHIAGSNGREVERMALYMAEESQRILNGEPPLFEVTKEMLKTMA